MINKLKTTKIVLFASLMIAMILPFSSMNIATAEEVDRVDKLEVKLENFKEEIKIIKEGISSLENEELINHLQKKLNELSDTYDILEQDLDAKQDQISTTEYLLYSTQDEINELDSFLEATIDADEYASLSAKINKVLDRQNNLKDRLDRQYAQVDDIIVGYEVDDIADAFERVEKYVTFASELHMVTDIDAMMLDSAVSKEDIQIILDFADVNDQIMDAFYNFDPNLKDYEKENLKDSAIEIFEATEFHKLFDPQVEDSVHQTIGTDDLTITFIDYEFISAPIITAFGVDEAEIMDIRYKKKQSSGNSYFRACGDYGIGKDHPPGDETTIYKSSTSSAKSYVEDELNMDRVPHYASTTYYLGTYDVNLDYAKVVSGHGCNNGEFRDQAIVYTTTSPVEIRGHYIEPNPEVLSYLPPDGKLWWGPYVVAWHHYH